MGYPPVKNPRVGDANAPDLIPCCVKSPKSTASPNDAIFQYSIVLFELAGVGLAAYPPAAIPRVDEPKQPKM